MPDPTHTVQNALRFMGRHPELPDELCDHIANLVETVHMLEKRLAASTVENGRHIRMIVTLRDELRKATE